MGADMHGFFIEAEASPGVWYPIARIHTDRDYRLFGLLAGVRSNDEPLHAPRGLPDDASWWWMDETQPIDSITGERSDADCHSHSWLTADELVEVQIAYVADGCQSPNPDLASAIMLMRMAEHPARPVRAGFCFDN